MLEQARQCPASTEAAAGRQNCKKVCKNCKAEFVIEPEDFAFYEKIKVPPPTWCPDCRMIRRFLFRNYNNFFRKHCNLCGSNIITNYSARCASKIFCNKCWWSDKWESLEYGKSFNFEQPFFDQFYQLESLVPAISLMNDDNINSLNCEYTYDFAKGKNCYLVFSSWYVEDSSYCFQANHTKNTFDCLSPIKSELLYESTRCIKCYRCSFLSYSEDCDDCHFSYNLKGCSNCFLSSNLRNKQYYFLNKPYSKEEYERLVDPFNISSFLGQQRAKEAFLDLILESIRKPNRNLKCINAMGDDLINCKDVYLGFIFNDVIQSKYMFWGDGAENCYDILLSGKTSLCYEGVTVDNSSKARFSILSWGCNDIYYSDYCHSSSHLFGCVGLRNKQYCILNKQYSKEEYETIVPKIIEHMDAMPYIDKKGRAYKYGEFFPPELSPFSYNETIAQEYFPLTKEEAIEQGYSWKDPEPRDYQITIKPQDLPDHIKDVPDSIVKEVIGCLHATCLPAGRGKCNEQCTEAFRIIPQELQFYRKMNLPLPRLCPNCRHYQRLKQRNPLKLWRRRCQCNGTHSSNGVYQNTVPHSHQDQFCPNTFETSYSPDRSEIVYCEACYLKEVV